MGGVLTVELRHYAVALLMSALHTLALAAKAWTQLLRSLAESVARLEAPSRRCCTTH